MRWICGIVAEVNVALDTVPAKANVKEVIVDVKLFFPFEARMATPHTGCL